MVSVLSQAQTPKWGRGSPQDPDPDNQNPGPHRGRGQGKTAVCPITGSGRQGRLGGTEATAPGIPYSANPGRGCPALSGRVWASCDDWAPAACRLARPFVLDFIAARADTGRSVRGERNRPNSDGPRQMCLPFLTGGFNVPRPKGLSAYSPVHAGSEPR